MSEVCWNFFVWIFCFTVLEWINIFFKKTRKTSFAVFLFFCSNERDEILVVAPHTHHTHLSFINFSSVAFQENQKGSLNLSLLKRWIWKLLIWILRDQTPIACLHLFFSCLSFTLFLLSFVLLSVLFSFFVSDGSNFFRKIKVPLLDLISVLAHTTSHLFRKIIFSHWSLVSTRL